MMRQTWSIHSTNPRLESEMLVIAWGQEQKIKVVSGRSFPCDGSIFKRYASSDVSHSCPPWQE
jgi:hypothetical protein